MHANALQAWQARGMDWWNRLTVPQREASMRAFAVRFPGHQCSVAACYDTFEESMPEPGGEVVGGIPEGER